MASSRLGGLWRRLRKGTSAQVVGDDFWDLAARPRRLSTTRYCAYVGLGAVLTAGQLLVLPRVLGARGFGAVALGISLTQAVFAFGDLGLGRMSDDTSRPKRQRDHLRTLSFAAASASLVATLLVAAVAMVAGWRLLGLVCALGALTAWELYPMQLRAQASEGYGDELEAARRHCLWQNGPKLGLIVGALVTREPVGAMLGGALLAILVSRPKLPSVGAAKGIAPRWRSWLPALLSVAAPFALTWSDTYFVAIRHGVAVTAGYVLVYRVLAAVSYLYLPFGSVLLSRLNRGDRRATWFVPVLSLLVTLPSLLILASGFTQFGRRLFPDIPLELAVVTPLVVMNLFANLSHLMGTTLAALGSFTTILWSNVAGAVVAIAGHLLFSLRGSLRTAAIVSLLGMAITALAQLIGARRALREGGIVMTRSEKESFGRPRPAGPPSPTAEGWSR